MDENITRTSLICVRSMNKYSTVYIILSICVMIITERVEHKFFMESIYICTLKV